MNQLVLIQVEGLSDEAAQQVHSSIFLDMLLGATDYVCGDPEDQTQELEYDGAQVQVKRVLPDQYAEIKALLDHIQDREEFEDCWSLISDPSQSPELSEEMAYELGVMAASSEEEIETAMAQVAIKCPDLNHVWLKAQRVRMALGVGY